MLQSAIANAENNHDLDVDDLVVTEASVGKNLVLKRFHARARGRGAGIEKFFARSRSWSRRSAKKRTEEAKAPKPSARRRRSRCQEACGQESRSQAREEGDRLMGQKVNPIGLRLGINRTWDSRWYAGKKDYGKLLQEDIKIRDYLSDKLKAAGVSRIIIERPHKKCRITIHSARPGVVIGKKGADIEKLKSDVQKYTTDEVHLNIVEIRKPEIDAKLVAENIAQQLERRVAFRRVMKRPCSRRCVLAHWASASTAAAVSAARKSRAWNGIAKAAFRCTRCAPTSTTASRPRRRPTAPAA